MCVGTFHAKVVEIILWSLGALCKILLLEFSKRYCSHGFEMISAKLHEDTDSHVEYWLLLNPCWSANYYKFNGTLIFFLNTVLYGA